MNVVTFETAKRLKSAGFPQPEKSYYGCAIYDTIDDKVHIYNSRAPIDWRDHWTFGASSTDILKRLGYQKQLYFDCGEWYCGEEKDFNPAEACALAWLSIHEK